MADPHTITQVAKVTPVKCPYARLAVAFYRGHFITHQLRRGAPIPAWRKPRNCADARYLANVWAQRAHASRLKTKRHLEAIAARTLPDARSWTQAVRVTQRVFPGTESWLLSCSDAEGYNRGDPTRWVIYGGGSYYPGAEHSYNGHLPQVGGPMQFMWGTFKGMYRHALEHAVSRRFIVPAHLRDPGDVQAWRSMLAQALAAGWARWSGNDNLHWSASFGNGC